MSGYLTIILVILTVNIFTSGSYVIYRGCLRKRRLNRLARVPATIRRGEDSFRGVISWSYQGIRMSATKRHLYLLGQREKTNIFYNPATQKVELDIWTNNGTGVIIIGLSITSISVAMALLLVM